MSDFKLDYIIKKVDRIDDRVRKLEIKNAGVATFISVIVTLGLLVLKTYIVK